MTVTIRTVVEVGEENRDKGRRTWKQIGGGWDLKRWKWTGGSVGGVAARGEEKDEEKKRRRWGGGRRRSNFIFYR